MGDEKFVSKVYQYISNKVQNGDYKEKQRITESEICTALGVSRTPAREALNILAGKNLLEKIPNKGFILKEFTEKEKLDTYEVIGNLDSLAGSLAISFLDENDISKMNELSEMMSVSIKYKNYNNYLKISNDFHNIYRYKCNNDVLINAIDSLIYNFIPKSYTSDDEDELFKMLSYSNDQHKDLVKAFTERNNDSVKDIIIRHWMTVEIHEMK